MTRDNTSPATATTTAAGEFFHSFADTFDSLYGGKRGPIWRWLDATFRRDIYERFRLTFEAFGDLTGKTVLDIGCGSGVYLDEALRRGASAVVGLDPAARMLELSRQLLDKNGFSGRYEFVSGLFPNTRPAKKSDHIIVMGVMDYVAEPTAFLTALRELTGQSAAISFPSFHWLRGPMRLIRYRLRRCPLFLYRHAQIEKLMTDAGFSSVSVTKIAGAGQDFHVVARP